jgi:bifunctional DNA-binding transcriptional regulator/antitoxin component of YhaV-PrlF toxin-antitoxin module
MQLTLTRNANALHQVLLQSRVPTIGEGKEGCTPRNPATITARGQTTVPAAIRKTLSLGKRDRVVFRGLADGTVVIAKKETRADRDDPVIGKFLEFCARRHPQINLNPFKLACPSLPTMM